MSAEQQQRKRRTPPAYDIACYWWDQLRTDRRSWPHWPGLRLGLGEPFCFRCGWLAPVEDGHGRASWSEANQWLDRAHVVDFGRGGSDEPSNLVILCQLCHLEMPTFGPDDQRQAMRWITADYRRPHGWIWQVFTDVVVREQGGKLPTWRRRFLETMALYESGGLAQQVGPAWLESQHERLLRDLKALAQLERERAADPG